MTSVGDEKDVAVIETAPVIPVVAKHLIDNVHFLAVLHKDVVKLAHHLVVDGITRLDVLDVLQQVKGTLGRS